MRVTIPVLATSVLSALMANAGMYGEPVVNLDAKTFKKVMATEHAAMVAFVAPWCGHCKSLAPEYTAAASSLSPLIPFYAVDCDAAVNKPLCGELGIKGFPTIKAYPRAGKGAARDYQGERKRGALIEYAKGLVPDRVKKLRVDQGEVEGTLAKFLEEKSTLPHALLIHPSSPSIPFLWKVLGHRLSSRMHLAYIKDSASHAALSSLGIYDPADTSRETTRAVVWGPGSTKAELVEYEGVMKFNSLLEWLQSHLPTEGKSDTKTKAGSKSQAQSHVQAKADQQAEKKRADANKRKAEEALEEEMIRDGKGTGTSGDSAPDAQPAEGVDDEGGIRHADYDSGAAEPSPAEGVEGDEEAEAKETQAHVREEL